MASKELKLSIEHRTKLGTTGSQALRAAGKIPAVVFGHGTVPDHIAVNAHDFKELLHRAGRNAVVTLTDDGKKPQTALVREVQTHPVTRRIVHADLQRISADETITARLGIVTVGVAVGVKDMGAVMDIVAHEIEVEGPANQIPEHLEVDVTALAIHDHVTAGDIALPAGFKLLSPPETLVVTIEPPRTHEEEAASAEGTAEPQLVGGEPATPEAG